MGGEGFVTISSRVPDEVAIIIDSLCYKEVDGAKVKMRDRSDIIRELLLEALSARGIIEWKKKAESGTEGAGTGARTGSKGMTEEIVN